MYKCIRCGSHKLEPIGRWKNFTHLFATAGTLLASSFILWPLFILAIPLLLMSPIAFLFPKVHRCHDCRKTTRTRKLKKLYKKGLMS